MLTEYDLQQILIAGFILNNFKIIENKEYTCVARVLQELFLELNLPR